MIVKNARLRTSSATPAPYAYGACQNGFMALKWVSRSITATVGYLVGLTASPSPREAARNRAAAGFRTPGRASCDLGLLQLVIRVEERLTWLRGSRPRSSSSGLDFRMTLSGTQTELSRSQAVYRSSNVGILGRVAGGPRAGCHSSRWRGP